MKSFYFWAAVAPTCTAFIFYKYLSYSSENAGYALPFIAMGAVAIILIAATIIGLLSKTFKKSISGALVGLPLSYFLVLILSSAVDIKYKNEADAKESEFRTLLPILESQKKEDIAVNLKKLNKISLAQAMCILSGSREGAYASLLQPENSNGTLSKYPFSLDQILEINEIAAGLQLTSEEKDAVFYQSLKAIVERDALPYFSRWATLWDKFHAELTPRTIQVRFAYNLRDNYCAWGSTRDILSDVVEQWHDEGLLAWLNTNHIFIPEQQRYVLQKVMFASTLEKVVASGTDINAKYPGETDDAIGLNSVLSERASWFYQMINEAKDPASVSQLAQTFVHLGADIKTKSSGTQTPCQIFSATEAYLDKTGTQSKSSFSDKQKAFKAVQKTLCTF